MGRWGIPHTPNYQKHPKTRAVSNRSYIQLVYEGVQTRSLSPMSTSAHCTSYNDDMRPCSGGAGRAHHNQDASWAITVPLLPFHWLHGLRGSFCGGCLRHAQCCFYRDGELSPAIRETTPETLWNSVVQGLNQALLMLFLALNSPIILAYAFRSRQ